MEKVIDNIYMKKIIYFNLYVIKGTDGDILIDTGFFCMKKSIKKWHYKFNIKLIILTHAHIDHSWNVAYIKKLYNCEVALGKKDLINISLLLSYFFWLFLNFIHCIVFLYGKIHHFL